MTNLYRMLFCLLLSLVLVGLLLSPGKTRGAQASKDDCQDCLTTCNHERQFCLENGNPPTVCFAAWRECVDYCQENFCALQ